MSGLGLCLSAVLAPCSLTSALVAMPSRTSSDLSPAASNATPAIRRESMGAMARRTPGGRAAPAQRRDT
eukprot:CAMPEP_0197874232 /NCGR_PEP_ID=MMETSP1439-20131203/3820_1 /TAXON_ID=66791 /ORGANISM="Gonyaulax spinifera, Strain CCMP409" /LENGTH=68 /DNA_ID=CAMNT_0043493331 /DNA_START=369 /DNA_END=575 /DNA_ORIENTATION=+